MTNLLKRLICDCDCHKSQLKKRSKYAPERDIDTVQTGNKARVNKESMEPDYDTPAAKTEGFY